MTIIEQIKAEIDKLYGEYKDKFHQSGDQYHLGLIDGLDMAVRVLDTLESERPEPYNPVYDEAYLNEKIKKATESWKGADVDAILAECRGYDEEKSEKPMNQDEELNRGIKRFVAEYGYERSEDILLIAIVARHFYDLGCRHTAEKYDEIEYNRQRAEESTPKDLEEAAHSYSESDEPLYSPGHRFHWDSDSLFGKQIETTFKAGAEWQKEQMMNEAVEAIISQCPGSNEIIFHNPSTVHSWEFPWKFSAKGFNKGDKIHIIIVKEGKK